MKSAPTNKKVRIAHPGVQTGLQAGSSCWVNLVYLGLRLWMLALLAMEAVRKGPDEFVSALYVSQIWMERSDIAGGFRHKHGIARSSRSLCPLYSAEGILNVNVNAKVKAQRGSRKMASFSNKTQSTQTFATSSLTERW
eukprot:TRINITY_DN6907_c0_g1_i1.p1 TRINITY_DN6907_c0_g1~~TRINITY_DN6907_c0_g1_i1.p1  ORF type:complete len:139 (-),score=6.11 TRINITY_DN6907_c0_g1_i1:157-573(-)